MALLVLHMRRENYRVSLPSCIFALLVSLVIVSDFISCGNLRAQRIADAAADFRKLAMELSSSRLGGGDENKAQLEKALAYLDSMAIAELNAAATSDVDTANRRLAALVSQASMVGENYRLVKLGGSPAVYAMVINFGLGGPAAVRIYAGEAGRYKLAGQIDRYSQKDFLDSDIELVPVSSADLVFVTVSGRTDDLSTGAFSAWQFKGNAVTNLWTSDLFQQSSYEAEGTGFRVAYCSHVDDDRPSMCLKMSRDLYQFEAGKWKRTETAEVPSAKPAAK
jgi:hypothetical protein